MWQLYLIFAGLGVAMAMALYEAAIPVLVSWFDATRRAKAILGMIVVAGFASTIFMPLTGWLSDRHGWRITLLLLAGLHAAVAVRCTCSSSAAHQQQPIRPGGESSTGGP